MDSKDSPPPSYGEIFGKLKEAKASSNNTTEYVKEASGVYKRAAGGVGTAICGVLCFFVGIALPVAEIVIGALHLYDCQLDRLIPIYLLVSGSFSIVYSIFNTVLQVMSSSDSKNCGGDGEDGGQKNRSVQSRIINFISQVLSSFLVSWTIAGSIWVFQQYGKVEFNDSTLTNYCHPLVYRFAFWDLIVKYIVIGIAVLVCCCCVGLCCCAACFAGKDSDQDRRDDGNL